MQFDITLPDFETRTAILEKKAEFDKIIIPEEVTKFIAKNVISNIRDLEGALNKIIAYAKLTQNPITIELAQNALKDIINNSEKQDITVVYIQEVVSKHYNVSVEDILSKKRNHSITVPRHVSMYLTRKLLDLSLPKIGKEFGGRDHSTVIHGCDKISEDIEKDPSLKETLILLEKEIKGN